MDQNNDFNAKGSLMVINAPEVSSTQSIENSWMVFFVETDLCLCKPPVVHGSVTKRLLQTLMEITSTLTLNLFKKLILKSTILYCKMMVEIAKLVGLQLVSWFSTKVVELTNQLENSTIHCCRCCGEPAPGCKDTMVVSL